MSSVENLGIRVSLIGGKAAALQSLDVAKGVQAIGTEAEVAGVNAAKASAGIDMLNTSVKGLDVSWISTNVAYTDMIRNGDMLLLNNRELLASTGALDLEVNASADAFAASATKMSWFDTALARSGIDSELAGARIARYGKIAGAALAAAALYVGYQSVKMASDYTGATASIAASANISIAKAKEISAAFLTTAGTTEFSATDITQSFSKVAGQLSAVTGVAYTTTQSMKFMRVAMDLATASGDSLSSSTTSLGTIMQVFHYNVNQAAQAANTLFNTSRLTNSSTGQLVTVMSRLHSRLQQVMPSLKDVSALTLDLAEHGAKGARGTMIVSGALNTLLSGSKGVNAMLETLGLSSSAFIGPGGKFIGMRNAIALLQPELAKLPPNLQLIAEKALFGAGASQLMGATVLSGAGYFDKATDAVIRHGVMIASATKQEQSLHGQIKIINSSIHDWMVALGTWLLPKLIAVGTWLVHNKPILVGFAAVIGTVVVGAFAAWTMGIIETAGAFVGLDLAMSVGVLGAILLLVTGIVLLATHWKQVWGDIKNWLMDAWHFIYPILHNDFILALMGPLGALIFFGEHWKTIWDGIKDVVTIVWNFLKPIFEAVAKGLDILGKAGGWARSAASAVGGFLGLAEGGVVPGPKGAPMMAVVHGGEVITPPSHILGGQSMSPTMLGMTVSSTAAVTSAAASVVPSQLIAGMPGGSGQPTIIQLVVDRKVLAETVYQQMQSDYARR